MRYRTNDYSVPVAYGHQEVWIRGYVHEVVIGCGAGIIARHPRSTGKIWSDPIHYLPLLEHKIGALDQAAPLAGWELQCLPNPAPSPGGAHGQGRQAGIRPGPRLVETFDLEVLHGAVKDALRLGAIGYDAVKHLGCAVSSDARPNSTWILSLPASGQRGDHGRRQLYELVGWRRVMTDTPQVLLAHHLKTLKLPTFLREYDKLARQCATEGADHVRLSV